MQTVQSLGLACTLAGQVIGIAVLVVMALMFAMDIAARLQQAAQDRRIEAGRRRDQAEFELELFKRKQSATQPE